MHISNSILMPKSPIILDRGSIAGGQSWDGEALETDQVVIGSNSAGASSKLDSHLTIRGRFEPNGASEVTFADQDAHTGLRPNINLDKNGNGLLTIVNLGPEGYASTISYPLGAVTSEAADRINNHKEVASIKANTGQGEDSCLVLDDWVQVYLDGRAEPILFEPFYPPRSSK